MDMQRKDYSKGGVLYDYGKTIFLMSRQEPSKEDGISGITLTLTLCLVLDRAEAKTATSKRAISDIPRNTNAFTVRDLR